MCWSFHTLDTIGKLRFAYYLMNALHDQLMRCLQEMLGAFGLADNLHYPDLALERLRRAIQWQLKNNEELLRTMSLLEFFSQSRFCAQRRLEVPKRHFACYCHAAFTEWTLVTGFRRSKLFDILRRWSRICPPPSPAT